MKGEFILVLDIVIKLFLILNRSYFDLYDKNLIKIQIIILGDPDFLNSNNIHIYINFLLTFEITLEDG